ncbi:DUF1232 domain-containing protein [Coprothermobacteraceae bacterium]|nr:DUF1232 domain-containing protein [Coprothermobacteraceae bacterium]
MYNYCVNLKERAEKLKTDIPALYIALGKKETPVAAKICAGLAVAYALSPVDLIPDFVPILGYLDDVVILPALVALTVKFVPKDVFEECRKEARGLWDKPKLSRWYFALPVVALWIVLFCALVRLLRK